MKRWLTSLLLMLCASAALAQAQVALTSETKKAVTTLVQAQLVKPLQRVQAKRSRFSRVGPVSIERRVRVTEAVAHTDARGKTFVRFAIDTRMSEDDAWDSDAMLGCAYPNEKKVFVQRGDDFLLPSSVFGGDQHPQVDVCRPAPVAELAAATL